MCLLTPVHHSSMLYDLSAILSQPFQHLADCLPLMLPVITRHLGVQAAFVSQMTPTTLTFLGAVDHANGAVLDADHEPLLNSFCQYIYATGQPVVVTNAADDPRVQLVELRQKFLIGSYIGVPIIRASGLVDGSLCALDPAPHEYDADQLAFLRSMASKLAWVMDQDTAVRSDLPLLTEHDVGGNPSFALRMLAHDIRSPLTSIFGYCEMLLQGVVSALTLEQQTIVSHVLESSRYIHRLATDMVASVDGAPATMTILPDQYDPTELVQRMHAIYVGQAHQKSIAFRLVTATAPPRCYGDVARVQQVLANLISNAIQATQQGSITVVVDSVQGAVIYCVQDTGPGIPTSEQDHIWDLHVRGQATHAGFGIGLYVVRQLVEAMGGMISLTSAVGQGSRFTIRFPVDAGGPSRMTLAGD